MDLEKIKAAMDAMGLGAYEQGNTPTGNPNQVYNPQTGWNPSGTLTEDDVRRLQGTQIPPNIGGQMSEADMMRLQGVQPPPVMGGQMTEADMMRLSGVDAAGQDPLAGMIEQSIRASGNQPVNPNNVYDPYNQQTGIPNAVDPIDELLRSLGAL